MLRKVLPSEHIEEVSRFATCRSAAFEDESVVISQNGVGQFVLRSTACNLPWHALLQRPVLK